MLNLAATVFLGAIQCAAPSEDRVLGQVRASFPFSLPNAFATSVEGQYIYCGEGGTLAVVDTLAGEVGYDDAPRIRISDYGPKPASMLFDPGVDSGGDDDMLVICAGRSGLWVMDANPPDGVYRAAAVDDSATGDPSEQANRRYCNNAATFTIDGEEYLAATFAKKNQSRLRIYDMNAVRAVLSNTPAGEWSGYEIAPLHNIKIRGRRGLQTRTDVDLKTHNYSFTIGLAADAISADEAHLYLALWHQGLARVRVEKAPGGGLVVSGVENGPVFGAGSHYNTHPSIPQNEQDWYDNYQFFKRDQLARNEPPIFTDVAVQNFHGGHYLYATLDTLGWVSFDLSDAWSPTMDIHYHAGEPSPPAPDEHPFGQIQFQLAELPEAPNDFTYLRSVRVLDHGDRTVLAVHGVEETILSNLGYRTEGTTFNHDASTINAVPVGLFGGFEGNAIRLLRGGTDTYIYDIDAGGVPTADPILVPGGGGEIELLPGATLDEAELFVQSRRDTLHHSVDLVTGASTLLGDRLAMDRPGFECLGIGYSIVNPNVILTASNDGGFPTYGSVSTCGSILVHHFEPHPTQGGDNRVANGLFFDQEGQWATTDAGYAGTQIMIGDMGNERFAMRMLDPGFPCAFPSVGPMDVHAWRVTQPFNRFGNQLRQYVQACINDEYDADTGMNMVFVSGGGSTEGILALDRAELEAWAFANMSASNGTDLDLNDTGTFDVLLGTFNTDPEFNNVPDIPGFLQCQEYPDDPTSKRHITGKLFVGTPRLFKVPSAPGMPADRWFLIGPCGWLDNGEEDLNEDGEQYVSYTDNPDWAADAPWNTFEHSLVQFWDVTDPNSFPADEPIDAVAAIVGPDENASALHVKVTEYLGSTYAFVVDFAGRVFVYDVTGVAWGAIDLIATFEAPLCLTDDLPNNIYEIALDHAEWSSGGEDLEALYVYVGVERVGIEVLRFDPTCPNGDRLEKVRLVQTPGNVRAMVLRDQGGDKTLVVNDGDGGLRILEYDD